MKRKHMNILKICLISASPLCFINYSTSCAKISDTPHDNLSKKLVDFITGDDYGQEVKTASFLLYIDNDSKLPYISVNDFVNLFNKEISKYTNSCQYKYSVDKHNVTITKLDGKENTFNAAKLTIKVDENKLVYSDYLSFIQPQKINNGLDTMIVGKENYFIADKQKTNWYKKGDERIIDLNKYGFKSYFINGNAYLPFYVLRNAYTLSFESEYLYNGNNTMFDVSRLTNEGKSYLLNEYITNGMYNSKYMEEVVKLNYFNFNEFFCLDKKVHPLTKQTVVYPKDEELLKAFNAQAQWSLGKFNELFKSTQSNVFKTAMTEFGEWYFDDGGHTNTNVFDMFSDSLAPTRVDWHPHGIWSNTLRTTKSLQQGRADAEIDPTLIPTGQPMIQPSKVVGSLDAIGCYAEYSKNSNVNDNIAYITFDSFKSPSSTVKYKPQDITDNNYYLDTMSLIYYSNKKIRENGIKNLVIDVSVNGGGSATALSFILSWICNGATEVMFNKKLNASLSTTYYADVNLDNKFDENDVLPNDVNLYVITSNSSFSCGNALPVFIKMFANRNVKFLGERSGGGSCVVAGGYETGVGSRHQFSGPIQLAGVGCSADDLVDNENGVEVDYSFTLNKQYVDETQPTYLDTETFKNFYDRNSINQAIWNKRGV